MSQPATDGELRERLLAYLLDNPEALLLELDDARAWVRTPAGVEVELLTHPGGELDMARLRELSHFLQKIFATGHVVVVGGGAEGLVTVLPIDVPGGISLHHVASDGTLKDLHGEPLARLENAVASASETSPLQPEAIAARLAVGSQHREGEERFAAATARGFPLVTTTIAAICIVVFGLDLWWGGGELGTVLLRSGANIATHVAAGEVWRVFSSAFLHGSFEHLFVNMLALASFGIVLERLLGRRRFIVLYVLSALGGGLASALLRRQGLSVGASGAIWGLMTAGVGLSLRPRGLLPPLVLAHARKTAALPLLLNVGYSFLPRVDALGHLGGGVVGLLLIVTGVITAGLKPVWSAAPTDAPEAAPRSRRAPALTALATVLAVAFVGSLGVALASGRPWTVGDPPVLVRVEVADTGISLELPDRVAGPPRTSDGWGRREFVFTTVAEPLAVELMVLWMPSELTADELREHLETLRKQLDGATPEGLTRSAATQTATIGGRPALHVRYTMPGFEVPSRVLVLGDRTLVVRVYLDADRPASWAGVEQRIAASIQRR